MEEATTMKRTQKECIKEFLLTNGSISPMEALEKFGCFRLASRISELRREGIAIETHTLPHKRYAVYVWKPDVEGK